MRIFEYIEYVSANAAIDSFTRWQLYRLLGEPVRLQLLALAATEELAIGELAELLGESQPNVSRHLKPLRSHGLIRVRKQGTRVLAHLSGDMRADPVIADAIQAGTALCAENGSLNRIADVVRARDAASREFFDRESVDSEQVGFPSESSAYLTALGLLLPRRELAIDAGTGDGRLLEVLSPMFAHVLAVDRARAQLARAASRIKRRAYQHVELVEGDIEDAHVRDRAQALGGASLVCASRVLHHAPRPVQVLRSLGELAAEDGFVMVIDYVSHDDERLRDQQTDTWLGFAPGELVELARGAGLEQAQQVTIPAARCGDGPDGHLDWQVLLARRPRDRQTKRISA